MAKPTIEELLGKVAEDLRRTVDERAIQILDRLDALERRMDLGLSGVASAFPAPPTTKALADELRPDLREIGPGILLALREAGAGEGERRRDDELSRHKWLVEADHQVSTSAGSILFRKGRVLDDRGHGIEELRAGGLVLRRLYLAELEARNLED